MELSTDLAPNGFDNCDENDRADKGYEKAPEIEAAYAAVAEEADEVATKGGADDTDNHIKENSLLTVRLHDERCDPADDATEDDIDEKAHNGTVKWIKRVMKNYYLISTLILSGMFTVGFNDPVFALSDFLMAGSP